MEIMAAGALDQGKKRAKNEDYYLIDRKRDLFVLADGLGGHQGGDVASELVCRAFLKHMYNPMSAPETLKKETTANEAAANGADAAAANEAAANGADAAANGADAAANGADAAAANEANEVSPAETMKEDIEKEMVRAFQAANFDVFDRGGKNPKLAGMGATFVAGHIKDGQAYFCHAGDSRAYLIREKNIRRLTEDHSMVADLIREGVLTPQQAEGHPFRHQVTLAAGIEPAITPSGRTIAVRAEDIILLCSDGLWGLVSDTEMKGIIEKEKDLETAGLKLVEKANKKGGDDNISLILIKVSM